MLIQNAIEEHKARSRELAALLARSFRAGLTIYWLHQGNEDRPQSGTVINVHGAEYGIERLSWRVLNGTTGRAVTVTVNDLDPGMLVDITIDEAIHDPTT